MNSSKKIFGVLVGIVETPTEMPPLIRSAIIRMLKLTWIYDTKETKDCFTCCGQLMSQCMTGFVMRHCMAMWLYSVYYTLYTILYTV